MKSVLRIAGVLVGAIGAVWIGQGVGLLPGSFMSGRREWAVYGALALSAGLLLSWWSWRGTKR